MTTVATNGIDIALTTVEQSFTICGHTEVFAFLMTHPFLVPLLREAAGLCATGGVNCYTP